MRNIALLAATLLVRAWAADAPAPQLTCDPSASLINDFPTVCQVVEVPIAFSGSLNVTTPVGAITVTGWDQPVALVRARIEATAPTWPEAGSLFGQVHTNVSGDSITAAGPPNGPRESWSVAYEIFLPRNAGLSLTTKMGAISISDVKGVIRFDVSMGAVSLVRLAGDVQGSTHMGAISIVLDGDHWEGQTLAVTTNMGAIAIQVPSPYSAHFALSTKMGKIDAGYLGAPAPSNGFSFGGSVTVDTGSGGATISAATHMGAISVKGN